MRFFGKYWPAEQRPNLLLQSTRTELGSTRLSQPPWPTRAAASTTSMLATIPKPLSSLGSSVLLRPCVDDVTHATLFSRSGITIYGATSNTYLYSSNTVTISRDESATEAGSDDASGTVRVEKAATGVSCESLVLRRRKSLESSYVHVAMGGQSITSTSRTHMGKDPRRSRSQRMLPNLPAMAASSGAIKVCQIHVPLLHVSYTKRSLSMQIHCWQSMATSSTRDASSQVLSTSSSVKLPVFGLQARMLSPSHLTSARR